MVVGEGKMVESPAGSVPGTPKIGSKEDLKEEKGGVDEAKRKSWSLSGLMKKATA